MGSDGSQIPRGSRGLALSLTNACLPLPLPHGGNPIVEWLRGVQNAEQADLVFVLGDLGKVAVHSLSQSIELHGRRKLEWLHPPSGAASRGDVDEGADNIACLRRPGAVQCMHVASKCIDGSNSLSSWSCRPLASVLVEASIHQAS